jgi:hypothetical protein
VLVVLTEIQGTIREDVEILANAALRAVEGVSEVLIPVDLYGKGVLRNAAALRACLRASRGLSNVFPAGRILRFNFTSGNVEDPDWTLDVPASFA